MVPRSRVANMASNAHESFVCSRYGAIVFDQDPILPPAGHPGRLFPIVEPPGPIRNPVSKIRLHLLPSRRAVFIHVRRPSLQGAPPENSTPARTTVRETPTRSRCADPPPDRPTARLPHRSATYEKSDVSILGHSGAGWVLISHHSGFPPFPSPSLTISTTPFVENRFMSRGWRPKRGERGVPHNTARASNLLRIGV